MQTLKRLESHAKELGRKGFTRSAIIREAVEAYVQPLVALLDHEGFDWATYDRPTGDPEGDQSLGETTRVRLTKDLVEQLDRIEAYARGLGYRHVTRSSLIRKGVRAYLSGFRAELLRDDASSSRSRNKVASTRK